MQIGLCFSPTHQGRIATNCRDVFWRWLAGRAFRSAQCMTPSFIRGLVLLSVFAFTHLARATQVPVFLLKESNIGSGELMPPLTMSLEGVFSRMAGAAPVVFCRGDSFQVSRIETQTIFTPMIYVPSCRDRATPQFVSHTVNKSGFSLMPHPNVSITLRLPRANPALFSRTPMQQESFCESFLHSHNLATYSTVAMRGTFCR